MQYPITENFLKEYETNIEKKTGKSISPNRREHAAIVAGLINDAYISGYSDGLQAAKGAGR